MNQVTTSNTIQPSEHSEFSFALTITNRLGLHARAAAKLAKAAENFTSNLTLATESLSADARSILELLSLGCSCNSRVVLRAAGVDAFDALTALKAIIEDRFGEE